MCEVAPQPGCDHFNRDAPISTPGQVLGRCSFDDSNHPASYLALWEKVNVRTKKVQVHPLKKGARLGGKWWRRWVGNQGKASEASLQAAELWRNEQSREAATSQACGLLIPPGLSVWDKYSAQKLLGEGKYGSVWRCTDRTSGQAFACKTLTGLSSRGMQQRAEGEISIMTSLCGHPNIVGVREAFWEGGRLDESEATTSSDGHIIEGGARDDSGATSSGATVHIIMEHCNEGDLFDLIANKDGGMDESEAKLIFRQVAQGLGFCHQNGILHRDVKPENVFLHRSAAKSITDSPLAPSLTAKLGDFGLSQRLGHTRGGVSGRAGSAPYSAPEVEAGGEYSFPADIWSLGVLLCCMLTGTWPQWDPQGGRPVLRGQWGEGGEGAVSPLAADLVERALSLLPRDRPSIGDVLAHPWLQGDSKTAM